MPLGNILKLLSAFFKGMLGEPAEVTDLQITEDLPSPTIAENTEVGAATRLESTIAENLDQRYIQQEYPLQTSLPRIFEEKDMIKVSMLQDELQNFVSSSAEVQGAILASPDGLALASVLSIGMDEERTAAMSASMLSLGERIGSELARGNVDRIVVEGEKGYGVLVSCGYEAILLVLASAAAKQGILFLEVKQAAAKIAPLLN